ncbi:cytochrome P450 [Streptomyces sp. A 4/2]|uniref:cytochrome P450 n=1 Tax=Streptomyces sp. A 4/2 TaxID=2934314 RepID=UPI00202492E5|nr:cytochrome P450 [Streptomyces sp. A 4/2]
MTADPAAEESAPVPVRPAAGPAAPQCSLAAAPDPYPLYRTLRERHPPAYDPHLGAWLVSRYTDVVGALRDARLGRPRSVSCCEPGDDRCGAPHLLAPRAVREHATGAFREIAERTAYVLASRLARRPEADLVAEFCRWLPSGVVATAAGLPYDALARGDRGLPPTRTGPGRRGRGGPGTAALAGLLADRAALTEKALASLIANLLDHPAQLAAVREDPALIPRAWAETLRRNPPVHVLVRRAVQDVPLAGGTVPAGAAVGILIGSAGRDHERFAAADDFDLFRPDPGRLALGPPGCPVAEVAALQAQYGLRALLEAMPGLRWADGFRPVETGLLTRAPRALCVRPA